MSLRISLFTVPTILLAAALTFTAQNVFAKGHGGMHGGGMGSSTQPQSNTGVAKGQLSTAEIERLKSQEESLQKLSDTLDGDAKLTPDELKTLRDSLDSASAAIWSNGSDEDGKITTRYGNKFFLVDKLSQLLLTGPITRPQARELLTFFRAILSTRASLSGDDLTADQRTTYQKKLDEMINKYFIAK